jgi:hypothetical protein
MTKQTQDKTAEAPTTALAPTNGANLPALSGQPDGMSGAFDQGDLKLPTCSLVQPMSQDRGAAGGFWFDQEGRNAETFTAVVLNIIGTAAMWEPIGSETKGPVCKSIDRVMGLTNKPSVVLSKAMEDNPLYLECARCPHHADWEIMKSGPLHCGKGFTLLMCDTETQEPFLYYVKGTQFSPVRDRIVSPALIRRKRYGNAEPWLTPFTWGAREVVQPGKKYWVPVITMEKPLDAEQRAFYADLSAQMAGKAELQAIEEMEEQGQADLDLE